MQMWITQILCGCKDNFVCSQDQIVPKVSLTVHVSKTWKCRKLPQSEEALFSFLAGQHTRAELSGHWSLFKHLSFSSRNQSLWTKSCHSRSHSPCSGVGLRGPALPGQSGYPPSIKSQPETWISWCQTISYSYWNNDFAGHRLCCANLWMICKVWKYSRKAIRTEDTLQALCGLEIPVWFATLILENCHLS